MNEDWAAVGKVIAARLEERGMTMTDLANQADVSLTTVRELSHASSTRRRHPRTLGKLAKALGWPEEHLLRVLRGNRTSEPDSASQPNELEQLRREMQELRNRVESLEERTP